CEISRLPSTSEKKKPVDCNSKKKKRERRRGACFNCGREGHRSYECPEPRRGRHNAPIERRCLKCGEKYHNENFCENEIVLDNKPVSTHIESGTFFDKFYDEKVELSHSSGKDITNLDVFKVESFEELGLSDI
ncbi:hypothetical protein PMAYCL1PPCAC_25443, partial [Pristionchus mayeri]